MVTAWTGVRAVPEAERLLDLGAGIGSVGLMALHQMRPSATTTLIEALELSHDLCRRTVEHNALQGRVRLRLGDFREEDAVPVDLLGATDLVTGSPPYIPLGDGVISPHPQRAAARMELRGDVFDYCRVAARAMAPHGRFCFCHAAGDRRPEPAIEAAGLTLRCRQDVVFRRGRPPTIAVFDCGWIGTRVDVEPLVVREADGRWTDAYRRLRAELGEDVAVSRGA